jgi:hypothetical protein
LEFWRRSERRIAESAQQTSITVTERI